ncbi:MAG: hypothetical protein IKB88_04465 [Clostridia bacterium]|nr:hypothetical protein [Clostridia bacterium]
MIDQEIREYIRLISSLSLKQSSKERIADLLIQRVTDRKEISGKYVAAASAVAFLVVSTFLIARGMKQDVNIM